MSLTPVDKLEKSHRASHGRLYEAEDLITWLMMKPGHPVSPVTKGSIESDHERLAGPFSELSIHDLIEAIESPRRKALAKDFLAISESFQNAFVHGFRPILGQRVVALSKLLFLPELERNLNSNLANASIMALFVELAVFAQQ